MGKAIKVRILCVIFCMFLCGAGYAIFRFQAYRSKPVSEISLFFVDPAGQESVPGVQVEIIRGQDNPDGTILYQTITEEDGNAQLEVPFGEYTVRWQAEGYYEGGENITVEEAAVSLQKYLLPCAEDTSAYIFLEWEGEEDLDLCVYDEQNDRFIGRVSDLKGNGSRLYEDNDGEKGYELAYLKSGTTRNYIIYAKDGDSIAENHDSSMDQNGETVSIYTENGLQ